jgi:chromosomal replication initiation ATPase DnaA
LLTESNRPAWNRLLEWRSWPSGALTLIGPQGAGKSHMALAWAETVGAAVCGARQRALDLFQGAEGRIVIDDADRYPDEPHLALLLDAARSRPGAAVLLVGEDRPEAWPVRLRDLRSRLSALPTVALNDPDDTLLMGLLERHCRARFIKLTEKAGTYLAAHMERSFAGARAVAEAIDRIHARGVRPVSIGVAARALRSIRADAPAPDPGADDVAEEA